MYAWSIPTLDRRLRYFNVFYTYRNVTLDEVKEAVGKELEGPGKLLNASVIGHPLGGSPGKGGDFVQDPVKVLDFPLLEGDTEQSKLRNSPTQMGITLKSNKPQ